MNWLHAFLLTQIVNHVSTFESNIQTSNNGISVEIPKPITHLVFEELDSSYKNPKKLKWHTEKSKKPTMVDIALEVAAREGINAMANLYQNIEPQIVKNGQILEDNHPAALLSKFSAPVEGSARTAMAAFATLSATKAFRRNNKESAVLGRQAQSQKVSFRRTPLEGLCPARDPPTCMPASQRYRTHDGTCNNRRKLRWGSAQLPFNRFLPPEYGDGVDSIRGSVEGGALSSARFVSLLVHGAKEGDAPLTLMIVQWGQLLDHDMTSTAQPRSINGSVPSCCGSKDFHPLCFPIKVPLDDPWLSPLKVRCLEFLRSAPAQRRDCVLSWREQTNQVTSYIDASPIYSSNAKTSDNARIFRNGLLIYGRGDPADDVCMRGAIAHQCIRSGDGRSGEQPGLLALHHVWVGEHNRIAMELSILNTHWSDEKVYQETRRIIGALFQHITFREFLPIVLGREVCKLFDLELVKTGYYTGYDPNVNPTVSNAFAAAAFRFGHSLVQNSYMRCDRNHNFIQNNVTLHEEFQQGDIGTAGSLHRLLRGMATQKALKRDEFITPELTNHLFQTPGFPFGLDLAAINIQRGRDHGIAPYTAWRQPCGLSPINTWDELANVVGPESAKRISHAYRNVHDIDLFVGGIAERPVVGGLVGPTFACIIAQQFSNSRKGDRFWYENPGFESSFTPAQLNSLRRVSLSSVLCRTVNGGTLQPYVFLPNDVKGNQRIKCGTGALEPIDLRPWLEQDPFLMSNEKIDHNIPSLPETPISTTSNSNKEEKGINNRIQNVTKVTHVDFIPNSSIGFHRVANMTKIHDKLDMAQKLVARPLVKPIRGVNNKLDKHRLSLKSSPKPTAASKRISTTRRTVVIHNVQIELRSANGANKELNNKNKKTDGQHTSFASTAQDTILKVAGVVKSQISAAMGFLSNNDEDASTKHLSRQMNDQSTVTTGVTNLTYNENKTALPTNTTYKNLTTVRVSKTETNIETPRDESNRDSTVNDETKRVIVYNEDNNQYNQQHSLNINSSSIAKIHTTPTNFNETTEELSNSNEETSKNLGKSDHYTEISKNMTDQKGLTGNLTVNRTYTDPTENERSTIFAQNMSQQLINDNINKHYMITENTSETPSEQHDTYKDFQAIINSALLDSSDQHKRVHRKTDPENIQVKTVEFHTNLDFIDKLRTLRVDRNDDLAENPLTAPELNEMPETNLNENYFTNSDELNSQFNTDQPPSLENVELRQYQERPIYKRPQKLLLDAPKSEQYEIEINIRQTNTKPPQKIANYEDYNSPNKRYDNDRYNQQYEFNGNSPSNSLFTPTTRIPYGTRTKPPTIIYIDEHDERTTTRTGIFQNILSFATNSLNSIRPQMTSTESPFNSKPHRIVNNGHNSSPESYVSSYPSRPYQHSKPSSSNYINGQQGFPQPGFPQGPNNYIPPVVPPQSFPHQNIYPPQALPGANSFSSASSIGGVAHASSNAVSTGHFGAIAGSASSSGGDSTFSFNIRPSPRPQLNLMSPESIKPEYELLPQRWPQYSSTPSYAVPPKPMQSVESFEYPPNKHDPFSGYTRKPPSYYDKYPNNVFDPAYDDIGRSELTIKYNGSKANQTKDNEADDYDYNDDDDDDNFRHMFKNGNAIEEQGNSKKNDKIDYLKLAEQTLTNRTQLNETIELDDNFVLPALRQSDTFIERQDQDHTETIPPQIGEQKSLGLEILAEDYDELLTGRSSFLDSQTSHITGQYNKLKKPSQPVAFAPIQILTKPERPDNWVIFDTLDEKPLLPVVQPDYNMETLAAAEVPMPFIKRKPSQTSTKILFDKNFSTEPTIKLTSEQLSNEFTTGDKIDELTTLAENLTDEPDKLDKSDESTTTANSDENCTETQNERLESTEIKLDKRTQDIYDETTTIQTNDSVTVSETVELTTSFDNLTNEPDERKETTDKQTKTSHTNSSIRDAQTLTEEPTTLPNLT